MSGCSLLLRVAFATVIASPVWAVTPTTPVTPYERTCAPCHERSGFGMQMLARRLGAQQSNLRLRGDLTSALIRLAVRRGIGAMPAMSRAEISATELDALITELAGAR